MDLWDNLPEEIVYSEWVPDFDMLVRSPYPRCRSPWTLVLAAVNSAFPIWLYIVLTMIFPLIVALFSIFPLTSQHSSADVLPLQDVTRTDPVNLLPKLNETRTKSVNVLPKLNVTRNNSIVKCRTSRFRTRSLKHYPSRTSHCSLPKLQTVHRWRNYCCFFYINSSDNIWKAAAPVAFDCCTKVKYYL